MSCTLLYCAWGILKKGGPLPDYIMGFILHFLRLGSSPPATVKDCLLIISLVFGLELDIGDLSTTDERQVNSICLLNDTMLVRATLPPSTLFADRALLRRGYSISEPNALVETVSKYKGLH